MTLRQVSVKMNLRLNKGDSDDYDNIWPYHKQEAFNKAVNEWVREQWHGKNQTREGDEESLYRVDDLQVLLVSKPEELIVSNKGVYSQTKPLPSDYLYFKRLTPIVSKGRCKNVRITSYLREEANADVLRDFPSFEFEETFHTIVGNRINIYHYNQFTVEKAELVYYRKPKFYDFKKLDTQVEFKDDVCELIVDRAVKILASDIENFNQKKLAEEREQNAN